jgi:isopenicillin-N epimerase
MSADPLGTTAASAASNELWGEDWPDVRAMWPLESTIAHLNHGAYGAVPRSVLEEQQSWRDRMEINPTRFFTRELPAALDEAGAEVGHFLGADPKSIVFVDNVTSAVSTVLSCFPLAPGDELLVTDHAYGAVAIAAHRWASASGAVVVTAHIPLMASDDEVLEAILTAVTPRTRLAVIDHVTSPTARRMPVASLVPALQERGAAVFVDGAHAPAMIKVELDRLEADFYAANLHKWGCAPRGTAVLQVAPRWRARLRPLVGSWRDADGFPQAFSDSGTRDVTAWLAAPRALRVLDHLGFERLRRHNVELAMLGQRTVAACLDLAVETLPRDGAVSMQLIPLPQGVAGSDAKAAIFQAELNETAAVEVAVTSWLGQGFIRVSAQAYNAPDDYARLAAALPGALWEEAFERSS